MATYRLWGANSLVVRQLSSPSSRNARKGCRFSRAARVYELTFTAVPFNLAWIRVLNGNFRRVRFIVYVHVAFIRKKRRNYFLAKWKIIILQYRKSLLNIIYILRSDFLY